MKSQVLNARSKAAIAMPASTVTTSKLIRYTPMKLKAWETIPSSGYASAKNQVNHAAGTKASPKIHLHKTISRTERE